MVIKDYRLDSQWRIVHELRLAYENTRVLRVFVLPLHTTLKGAMSSKELRSFFLHATDS